MEINYGMHETFDVGHMTCEHGSSTSNIGEQLLVWIMNMQRVWDESNAPLESQDKIIQMK